MKVEQLSVFIENKPGRLADVTRALGSAGVNIRALTVADTADFGVLRLIVDRVADALRALKDQGFTVQTTAVLAVLVDDRPGGLSAVLEILDQAGVNVEYMYAFVAHRRDDAVIVFRFDNLDEAIRALSAKGIAILKGEEVCKL